MGRGDATIDYPDDGSIPIGQLNAWKLISRLKQLWERQTWKWQHVHAGDSV
jgi:hypothetical protein